MHSLESIGGFDYTEGWHYLVLLVGDYVLDLFETISGSYPFIYFNPDKIPTIVEVDWKVETR